MTATARSHARMFHEVRDGEQARLSPDDLIRETHAAFDRLGVPVSPGRVIKLVRTYVRRVQGSGLAFGDYLDTQVALSEVQRRVVADELGRVVSYVDKTGETAVRNVMRSGARR